MAGPRDAPEDLPSAGAEGQRRLLFVAALGLHQRYQLASNEGQVHQGVQHLLPREGVANQHPCNQGAECQIDQGRNQGCAERQLI